MYLIGLPKMFDGETKTEKYRDVRILHVSNCVLDTPVDAVWCTVTCLYNSIEFK